ncbi:MAG: GyrI-like domain-containing protein [Bacteroidota bacterium]
MEPRLEFLSEKKLVGKHLKMSLSNNLTFELWYGFMTRRKEIVNNTTGDLFSMQVYDAAPDFMNFNENALFEKWAATEVTGFDSIPDGMEGYVLKGGLYAVFNHRGTPDTFPETLRFIFGTWLPASGYTLDNREHFEILGEKYKRDDPGSEEEVWIPLQPTCLLR